MHQVRFRLKLRPRPRWGDSQRSPDILAGFKEREGRKDERERKRRGEKGKNLFVRRGERGERRNEREGSPQT